MIQRATEAEVDERWSYVGRKREPRWLWHAIDHRSGQVLAYVFGRRKDEVFLKLKGLLEPFGITKYSTDSWGAYTRHLAADAHQAGKRNTQQIERKHLTLRTRITRLVRKTIGFSRSTQMPDIVIGLFVNRYALGCWCETISANLQHDRQGYSRCVRAAHSQDVRLALLPAHARQPVWSTA